MKKQSITRMISELLPICPECDMIPVQQPFSFNLPKKQNKHLQLQTTRQLLQLARAR